MKFFLHGVEIHFPYEQIYPEQLSYISNIIKNIVSPGNLLIEMPSGTGKTVALLSSYLSYYIHCKINNLPFPKLIYATRTVPEVEKAVIELKNIIRILNLRELDDFLGVALTSKKNLCINEKVLSTNKVDLTCRSILPDCDFYQNTLKTNQLLCGVYSLEDIKELGMKEGLCPYYLVRKLMTVSQCTIYTYNYLIDPQIYEIVTKNLSLNCVIFLDEAHNIDNYCIEALSFNIKRNTLDNAAKTVKILEEKTKEEKLELKNYLKKLIEKRESISSVYNLEKEGKEFLPGNLRNKVHFLSACKRLIEFYKTKLKTTHLTIENTTSLLLSIKELTFLEKRALNFLSERLSSLELKEDFTDLKRIIDFTTMASLYNKGFKVIFEPFDTLAPSVFNPTLRLVCLDASIAMKHVFKFRNVVVTSGTLSPIDFYPKILGFIPKETVEIGVSLGRNAISPLIVTKGNDQMSLKSDNMNLTHGVIDPSVDNKDILTSSFNLRSEPSVVRNYGTLVLEMSKTVPDGMVVFFPSYSYMEEIVSLWSESYFISEISKNKLVFVETPSFLESSLALENYKKCCENGRGAVLFAVARGKMSEGVDFTHGEGRCVILLGIPFQFTQSVPLKARLEFLKSELGIKESSFLTFDAMRHAAQCLGRVLRTKDDYGLMILADRRYDSKEKKNKLPKWIIKQIEDGHYNLSVDMAVVIAKRFFKEMAQEFFEFGLLKEEDVNKMINTNQIE